MNDSNDCESSSVSVSIDERAVRNIHRYMVHEGGVSLGVLKTTR